MIKIENVVLPSSEQLETIIMGMRNPKNSWDRSDSELVVLQCSSFLKVGEKDKDLMKRLANGGPVHAKYRRMIPVYATITAPMYWWSEYDTYKVGTVSNSCSKMHKLLSKPFEMSDFSFDKLPGYKKEVKQFRPEIDEENEVWKKYDYLYDVSSQGRVRKGTRILSGSLHNDGYIFVNLNGKQISLHRVVAQVFLKNPDPESKKEVNHKDGNKQNNCVDNLEWVTSSENQIHAIRTGLQPRPTKTYSGKFTPEQREEIKNLWDSGISKREIARRFGVSHTCINDIVNDKYKYSESVNLFEDVARPLVDTLNELRDSYLSCENEEQKKIIWYSILQLLPESYNQKRTVMLNYEVLANIYKYRKDHKLDEWKDFCKWIESLPMAEGVIYEAKEKNEKV